MKNVPVINYSSTGNVHAPATAATRGAGAAVHCTPGLVADPPAAVRDASERRTRAASVVDLATLDDPGRADGALVGVPPITGGNLAAVDFRARSLVVAARALVGERAL